MHRVNRFRFYRSGGRTLGVQDFIHRFDELIDLFLGWRIHRIQPVCASQDVPLSWLRLHIFDFEWNDDYIITCGKKQFAIHLGRSV